MTASTVTEAMRVSVLSSAERLGAIPVDVAQRPMGAFRHANTWPTAIALVASAEWTWTR